MPGLKLGEEDQGGRPWPENRSKRHRWRKRGGGGAGQWGQCENGRGPVD